MTRHAEVPAALAREFPDVDWEEHAPHPETCIRRLLAVAAQCRAAGPLTTAGGRLALACTGAELGHLAVLADLGLLEPVWEMFRLIRWTPEQQDLLERARLRWAARALGDRDD